MPPRDAQRHWDEQAAVYASGSGDRRFGKFLELYEEECWRHIQSVLPDVGCSFILEAGCGAGRWVFRLAPMGYRVVLSDLSPEMIKFARAKVDRLGLGDRVAGYHVLDICNMDVLPADSFDLVLALGGPLGLCRDPGAAVAQFHRVTKPGGHVICDVANRYRTALGLSRENRVDDIMGLLRTGRFLRPDGLADHRFGPRELADLFRANRMEPGDAVAVCPLFDFLPSEDQVEILEDESIMQTMREVGRLYAEDPCVVGLSGRLLIVGQKPG